MHFSLIIIIIKVATKNDFSSRDFKVGEGEECECLTENGSNNRLLLLLFSV